MSVIIKDQSQPGYLGTCGTRPRVQRCRWQMLCPCPGRWLCAGLRAESLWAPASWGHRSQSNACLESTTPPTEKKTTTRFIAHKVLLQRNAAASGPHLQLICIIKVDSDSRNHPSMEQRGQDLLSNGVCDEMEMQRVPPVGTESTVPLPEKTPLGMFCLIQLLSGCSGVCKIRRQVEEPPKPLWKILFGDN